MSDNKEILELRPAKVSLDPHRPYLWLSEKEPDSYGTLQEVNTIFLTNRECPFKCIMCDLWKHTLDTPAPAGAIPEQITYALGKLPDAEVLKLYNNGNFFDPKAIPPADYPQICELTGDYERVIVENHPKLCGEPVLRFRDMLSGSLEVALGLETIHPDVLPRLNKQITTDNFKSAVEFLHSNCIDTRSFILLNPPFLTDPEENIEWCLRSVEFAFDQGMAACSIIPTRAGNGVMDKLQAEGKFVPPNLSSFEEVIDRAITMNRGRIFADVWDLEPFSNCDHCFEARRQRLGTINLYQTVLPRIECDCQQETLANHA